MTALIVRAAHTVAASAVPELWRLGLEVVANHRLPTDAFVAALTTYILGSPSGPC